MLEPLAAELGTAEVCRRPRRPRGPGALARDAGDVDVFVSNAALPADGQVDEYTPEQIDRALDVNLRAPIVLARRADAGHGRSAAAATSCSWRRSRAIATTPGSALYSATKFGLRGFALALRQDLHGTGVGVTRLPPGFIDEAGMFAETGVKLPPGAPTRSPRDVADAVVRAIERGPAEINVAPILLRLGADLGGIAPAPVAAVSRRMGSCKIQAQLADAHRAKR